MCFRRRDAKSRWRSATYFGMMRAEAVELGKEAKAFTAAALQRPFTIQTRWRKVFGLTRYYACVFTADGNDLAELLVRNGLARIYFPSSRCASAIQNVRPQA